MLVEGRLEPHLPEFAPREPVRRDPLHLRQHRPSVDIGCAEQLQRPRRAASFAQSRALKHHRPGIAARHVKVGRIGGRVDPYAVRRPTEARRSVRLPPLHLDHPIIDIELILLDEPVAHLTQCHAVAHDHRPGTDEALPAREQRRPVNRSSRGVGPVEHPQRFLMLGRSFEHVEQGRDEGVDPAAQILQVNQHNVERRHHLA